MAIVFMDGFDNVGTGSELNEKWSDNNANGVQTATTNPRTGARHAVIDVDVTEWVEKTFSTPFTSLVTVGMAIYLADGNKGTGFSSFLLFYDSASFQISLQYSQATQKFRFRNNDAGTSTESTNAFDISQGYHYIEVQLTFDNITDGNNTVELHVNGATEIVQEAMDTDPQNSDQATTVRLRSAYQAAGIDTHIDDVYMLDANAPNNDFLGDVSVVTLYPDADGNVSDWAGTASPDWQQVDELTPDDATSVIASSTNGQQSLFSMDALTGVSAILGIQVNAVALKDGAGDGDLQIMTRHSGSNYNSSTYTIGASNYSYYLQQQDVNPGTSSAWLVADLNNAEFGVQQIS